MMTKKKMSELFDSILDGRTGYSVRFESNGYVHLYAEDDVFTANLIKRVCEIASEYFLGVSVDRNFRPYLLFSIL